jgi:PST family polysaccharide transporter
MFGRWVPGLPKGAGGVRSMVRLGGYYTVYSVAQYMTRQLDRLLIGWFWGDTPLGLYQRAYTLMLYPIDLVSMPLARVGVPLLSKLQGQPQRLRAVYVRMLHVIGFLTFPMMAILFVTVEDVLLVVCGSGWMAAAPLFRILTVAGFWQGIYNASAQPYVASGRTDRLLISGLCMAGVLTGAFLIGNRYGAKGVAVAYAVALNAALLPYLKYTYATIGLGVKVVFRELRPSLGASLVTGGLLWLVRFYVLPDECGAVGRLLVCGGAGAVIYLLWLWVWHRRYTERLIEALRRYSRSFVTSDDEGMISRSDGDAD